MPKFVLTTQSFNPRNTHCPMCREPTPEFKLMIGDTHKFVCSGCGFVHLGMPDEKRCVKCGCSILQDKGVPGEDESFPLPKPCSKCAEKLLRIEATVQLGGAAYKCVSCGAIGAFVAGDPRASTLFEEKGASGVYEIDKSICPQCNEDEKQGS